MEKGEEALFRCLRKDEKDMRLPGRKNGKIVDRKMVLAVCSNSPNIGIGIKSGAVCLRMSLVLV